MDKYKYEQLVFEYYSNMSENAQIRGKQEKVQKMVNYGKKIYKNLPKFAKGLKYEV